MLGRFVVHELTPDKSGLSEKDVAVLNELVAAARPLNRIFANQVYPHSSTLIDFLDSVDTASLPNGLQAPFAEYRDRVKLHFGPHDSTTYRKFVLGFSKDDFVNALRTSPSELILNVMFDPHFEPERLSGANVYRFALDSVPNPEQTQEIGNWIKEGVKKEGENDDLGRLVRRTFTDPYSVAEISGEPNSPRLRIVPYHELYKEELRTSAEHLLNAAKLTEDKTFSLYLREAARGLLTGEYTARDLLLLDVDNKLCVTLGPIETYIDKIAGVKTSFEAIVSIRNEDGTRRLRAFRELTADLIKGLPCDEVYKNTESPEKAPLDLVEAVYLSGRAAEGIKAIAHVLPNDDLITNARGYRKTIFINLVDAKARSILMPIAGIVLGEEGVKKYDEDTLRDAFLWHVISHESSHPLGRTKDGLDPNVRGYLLELYTQIEECKADTLGLYNLDLLKGKGVIKEEVRDAAYAVYTANVFRSIRLGTQSAHAKANVLFLNYQIAHGGITVNDKGFYVPDRDKFKESVTSLARELLTIEGEGDYGRAKDFSTMYGCITQQTQSMLDKIEAAKIPVDIHTIFKF